MARKRVAAASIPPGPGTAARIIEVRRQEALLKTGALQNAILNSANFSSIATDEKGVSQIFNVGAERILGYAAAEGMNKITPAALHKTEELVARAKALTVEFGVPIAPGFEAIVFKASRGIDDISAVTRMRKDGSGHSVMVSVTSLRDRHFYTRSLIESDSDALMTTDPRGIITDVNSWRRHRSVDKISPSVKPGTYAEY